MRAAVLAGCVLLAACQSNPADVPVEDAALTVIERPSADRAPALPAPSPASSPAAETAQTSPGPASRAPAADPDFVPPVVDLTSSGVSPARSSSCSFSAEEAARGAAAIAGSLAARLAREQGELYVAPTVINDKYSDCLGDLSAVVAAPFSAAANFTVETAPAPAGQNSGSSSVIPALIRYCRSRNIPYLAVTLIRTTGGRPNLSLRVLRVKDGITLAQQSRSL